MEFNFWREVNGESGFFYKGAENQTLRELAGTIEKVDYGALGNFVAGSFLNISQFGLQLYIYKENGASTILTLGDKRASAILFKRSGVEGLVEFNELPEQRREVRVYDADGLNYGFSLKEVDL